MILLCIFIKEIKSPDFPNCGLETKVIEGAKSV